MHQMFRHLTKIKYVPFKKDSIGYIGWVGYDNLGDEILYDAAVELFKDKKVLLFNDGRIINSLEKVFSKGVYQQICLGGGTLINTEGCLQIIKAAQQKCKNFFTFGSGVHAPYFYKEKYNECYLDEWKPILEQCVAIGVRGPLSKEILEEKGISRVQVIGDPALHFSNNRVIPKKKNKKIGINIGVSNGKVWGNEADILEFMVGFVQLLIDEGWDVSILPVVPDDMDYIHELVKKVNKPIEIFKDYLNLNKALSYLNDCDLFIGEKLHATILAVCMHTPSIMLEYRPKCLDFMRSMDLEKFNMRTDDLDQEKLLGLMDELYTKSDYYQSYIFERTEKYKQKINEYVVSLNQISK